MKNWTATPFALALLLCGCQSTAPLRPEAAAPAKPAQTFALRVLHINDTHSHLLPDSGQSLLLDGQPTQLSLGGFPRLVTAFRTLAQDTPNVLRLHAGDAVAGDLFYTLFKGEADADLMNQVCFDALALGNHEFDNGEPALRDFLDFLGKPLWRCQTPVLAANVRPAIGESPLHPFRHASYLRDTVVVERGGRRIGLVGLDTVTTRQVSNPAPSTRFIEEVAAAQAAIDTLRNSGVDIVLLLTHLGYQEDRRLAQALSGLDAIIGGHSHTPLGEALVALGINVPGPYPTVTRNADGDQACIVQAWQYGWALGRLDLNFDDAGRVVDCSGTLHLMIGDDLARNGQALTGAVRDSIERQIADIPELQRFAPDPAAAEVLETYARQRLAYGERVLTTVARRLCLRRAPGPYDRSRDAAPGCAEATDAQGGEVQALVAEAFLASAARVGGADLALQNGGGVRAGIAPGAFTVAQAYGVLPFKNSLVRIELTGAELRETLEGAVDFFLQAPATNTGAYPHAAGLRWRLDLSRPRGERFSQLEIASANGWQPLEPTGRYRVVTTDYLASGKDGYDHLAQLPPERRADLAIDYAESLIQYADTTPLEAPPTARRSTQGLRDSDGREWQTP